MKKPETKKCLECGLDFSNRKSWRMRGQWSEVKYCSNRCRTKAAKN